MSQRQSFLVVVSTFCLVLLLPAVAAAQYTRDEVFSKLRLDGLSRGNVQSLVEGMPQGLPVRLEFPEISLSRNVGRNVNATAILEEVFKRIHPKFLAPDPDWDEKLKQSKESTDNVGCVLKGRWRVEIDGQSQLRELYISLRNNGDVWLLIGLRMVSPEQ